MMEAVCYDRGVERGVVSSYVRSKFGTQHVDFWATPEGPFEHPVEATSTR